MDIYSGGFLIIVVILGGFIAWIADRLGRHLGKKRYRFWNLRPRHTAELMTFAAGVLIPLFTVLIIMGASSDVRLWLIEGRRAIVKSQELQTQVDSLKTIRDQLNKDIAAKEQDVKEFNKRLKATQEKLNTARIQAARYQAEAEKVSARAAVVQKQLATMTAEFNERKRELAAAKLDITKRKADVAQLEANYEEQAKEYNAEFLRLDKQNSDLDKKNKKLNLDIKQYNLDISNLKQDKDSADADLQLARKRLAQANEDFKKTVADYEVQITEKTALVDALSQKTEQLSANIDKSRVNPMIFSCNEELVRLPLGANISTADAMSAVSAVERSSRIVAEQKGARSFGDRKAAQMNDIVDKDGKVLVSVEELKSAIVQKISNSSEHWVLIASARYNAFRGEWIPLSVVALPNPLVYTNGQLLADNVIDGTQTEDDIFKQISGFLKSKIASRARNDKLIPIGGPEESFGMASQEKIIELVRRIKTANRKIRLRVEADTDTRAAGPLALRFSLR